MFKQIKSIIVERIHFRRAKHAAAQINTFRSSSSSSSRCSLLRCRRWMVPLLLHICQSAVGNRFVNLVITCHSAVVATLWALLKQSVNSFELAQSGCSLTLLLALVWLLFASSRFVRPLAVPVAWSGLVCSVCLPIVWLALTCEALGQYLSPTRCANVPSVVAVGLQLSPCLQSAHQQRQLGGIQQSHTNQPASLSIDL